MATNAHERSQPAASSGKAKTDFRVVLKDIATNGCSPEQARSLTGKTRELFSEWDGRVTVMPVYFHNSLGESQVDLSGSPTADHRAAYTLCHQPWTNLTVDFAGRVVACCRDLRSEFIVGNLLEQPAAQIWNGERMMRLRRALASKQPEEINVCKKCDVPWHGSYSGRTPLQKIRSFFFSKVWKR